MFDQSTVSEVIKKKIKFQNTTMQNGTRLMDTLPEADESINRTQITLQSRTDDHSDISGNDLTFIKTMTNEELNNHIQKCLEMSSENKITPKNAFALQLIDCMNVLLQKEDFSVMACTLDASQKIYAYRIDGLHQQVIKLAEEVIHNHNKNKKSADGEKRDDDNVERLRKDKRKANKKNILALPENLNRKLINKNPRDKFTKLDGMPGAIMSSVRRDQNDLSFTLENSAPFWYKDHKLVKVDGIVEIPECKIFRDKNDITRKNNNFLDLTQFEATKEIVDKPVNDTIQIPSQEGVSDNIIMEEPTLIDMDSQEIKDEYKSVEEEVDVISIAKKRLNDEARENGEMCAAVSRFETMKIIFNQVSDYHYLNMEKAYYWAGPQFWKRSKVPTLNCKDKNKFTRKRKDPSVISYTGPEKEEMLNKILTKRAPLNRKTIMRWKMKNVTYANDLKVEVTQFLDLFHMSRINESEETSPSNESHLSLTEAQANHDISNDLQEISNESNSSSSQDTLNSCFYETAPENSGSPGDFDPLNSAFYDVGLTERPETIDGEIGKILKVEFSDSNSPDTSLIAAPKMVKFQPIKYKTKPTRLDMQHLKHTMLKLINEGIDENEQEKKRNISSNGETLSGTKFSNVLQQLPDKLERRTAEELSSGMALLALLTLANENNLQLKNCEGYSDVVICHEAENL